MKLVVGLGNPGDKYLRTLHNMGFMAAEALLQRMSLKAKTLECSSKTAVTSISGQRAVIAFPQTYMNLSGVAVLSLVKKYGCDISEELLIIYDDVDLPAGALRIRAEGSAGTHNGMRNIIDLLGTESIRRIRIGIGKPPEFMPLTDYVLSLVPKNLYDVQFDAILRASEAAERFINGADFEAIMREFNA